MCERERLGAHKRKSPSSYRSRREGADRKFEERADSESPSARRRYLHSDVTRQECTQSGVVQALCMNRARAGDVPGGARAGRWYAG